MHEERPFEGWVAEWVPATGRVRGTGPDGRTLTLGEVRRSEGGGGARFYAHLVCPDGHKHMYGARVATLGVGRTALLRNLLQAGARVPSFFSLWLTESLRTRSIDPITIARATERKTNRVRGLMSGLIDPLPNEIGAFEKELGTWDEEGTLHRAPGEPWGAKKGVIGRLSALESEVLELHKRLRGLETELRELKRAP